MRQTKRQVEVEVKSETGKEIDRKRFDNFGIHLLHFYMSFYYGGFVCQE